MMMGNMHTCIIVGHVLGSRRSDRVDGGWLPRSESRALMRAM